MVGEEEGEDDVGAAASVHGGNVNFGPPPCFHDVRQYPAPSGDPLDELDVHSTGCFLMANAAATAAISTPSQLPAGGRACRGGCGYVCVGIFKTPDTPVILKSRVL